MNYNELKIEEYDLRGNLIYEKGHDEKWYEYDAKGRPTCIKNSSNSSACWYEYDDKEEQIFYWYDDGNKYQLGQEAYMFVKDMCEKKEQYEKLYGVHP